LSVIVVGWDGVQRDILRACIDKKLPECPNGLPNLMRLSGGRVFNLTVTSGATDTRAGWPQLFSGYDDATTGSYSNDRYRPLPKGYSVFEKVEEASGGDVVTAVFAAGNPMFSGDCTSRQPWCTTKESIDYFQTGLGEDDVAAKAEGFLENNSRRRVFALFYFVGPDVSGHKIGGDSSEYRKSIVDADARLGRIMGKLDELNMSETTLVYVVTDHGHVPVAGHLNAPYGFIASNDGGIVRSGDRMDLAPTLLEDFGIGRDYDKSPTVRGHSLHAMSPVKCIPNGGGFVDYPGAPGCCKGLALINLTRYVGGQNGHCIDASGGGEDRSGYCMLCGNGICKKPEDRCNCPEDCL